MEKFRLHSDSTITAKVFLSFIASIVKVNLKNRLAEYFKDNSSNTMFTVFNELAKIRVTKIKDTYVRKYALTAKQKRYFLPLK